MSNSNKKWYQSKKFIALSVGVLTTLIISAGGTTAMCLMPIVAPQIVSLMTTSLATINGCIGIYAIGQTAIDWRAEGVNQVK